MFSHTVKRVSGFFSRLLTTKKPLYLDLEIAHQAVQASNVGVWDWDIPTGAVCVNDCWARIIGYSIKELEPLSTSTWTANVHPDDLATSQTLLDDHFQGRAEFYLCEARMKHKSGHWVWVLDRGQVIEWTKDGQPKRMIGTHSEITQTKKQQSDLEVALLAHQKVFNAVPHMLAYLDTHFTFQFYNDYFSSFFELDKETFNGHYLSPPFRTQFFADLLNSIESAFAGSEIFQDFDFYSAANSDKPKHMVLRVLLTPDRLSNDKTKLDLKNLQAIPGDNGVLGVFISIENITEIKQGQVQRELMAERFNFALKASHTGVWDFDLQKGILTWDEQMFKLYQVDPASFTQTIECWAKCVPKKDAERVIQHLNNCIDSRQEFRDYFPVTLADGTLRHIRAHARCVLDEQGTVIRLVGTNQDVTEEVKIKQDLESALKDQVRQHAMFEAMSLQGSIGAWELNLAKQTLYWSSETRKIHEVDDSFQPSIDTGLQFYLEGEHRQIIEAAFHRALDTGEPFALQSRICTAKGRIIWVRATGAVRFLNDEAVAVFGSFQDIDKQVLAEEALVREKEKAEAATRAKSLFLANMSHEIRTPMNGVLGMLNLLRKTPLLDDQRHRLELASVSATSLLRVINDILDFSKIEAGKLILEEKEFSLVDVIENTFASMAFTIGEKGLEPVLNLSQMQYFNCVGDEGRIRQVLNNLIGNAVKFTFEGSIQVSVVTQLQGDGLAIVFHVKDTGIGMDEKVRVKLFQSFSQADETTTRQYGGTGLGLAISLQLCKQMGGDIQVESVPGVGSCFSASIVVQPSKNSKIVFKKNPKTVLVVLESMVVATAVQQQLSALGIEAYTLSAKITDTFDLKNKLNSVRAEVAKLAAGDSLIIDADNPVFSDLHLKELNRQDIKVIGVVYNNTLPVERTACFYETLQAPIYFSRLIEVYGGIWPRDAARHGKKSQTTQDAAPIVVLNSASATHFNSQKAKQIKILLVEDNSINQEYAQALLQSLDFIVVIAQNGEVALQCLRAAETENRPFSLCFMDCQMPVLDGYEASRNIRDGCVGQMHRQVPIIALTANAMDGDREKCLAAGMDDYLTKPIDPDELEDKLRVWGLLDDDNGLDRVYDS